MKISVLYDGAKILRDTAFMSEETLSLLKDKTACMKALIDEYTGLLGPHEATLNNALEAISEALNAEQDPVNSLADELRKLAAAYQEIIDDDLFTGISRN